MANSSKPRLRPRNHQAAKPFPDFPLTANTHTKRWCKKIRGRMHYFGPLDNPQAALDKWNNEKEALYAGRTPREPVPEGNTLRDLANAYLRHKKALLENGELSPRTFQDNHRTCSELVDHFGKFRLLDDIHQEDFAAYRVAMAKRLGPVALGNLIQRTRSVFKFARESGMLKTALEFGPGFKRPSKKTLRRERNKKGPKLFTRDELRKLLDAAGPTMRAMVLLGLNGGLGNSDLANMPLGAVDTRTGWVNYPRPKTEIPRHFPLWPETLESLQVVIDNRTEAKNPADAHLLFITRFGNKFSKAIFERRDEAETEETGNIYRVNNDCEVAKEFNKLFAAAKIERKPGQSFYVLRHVFETVAGESRDQVAVDHVMGHARDDMASVYREKVSDERLQAAVEHVRQWLFAEPEENQDADRAIAGKVG